MNWRHSRQGLFVVERSGQTPRSPVPGSIGAVLLAAGRRLRQMRGREFSAHRIGDDRSTPLRGWSSHSCATAGGVGADGSLFAFVEGNPEIPMSPLFDGKPAWTGSSSGSIAASKKPGPRIFWPRSSTIRSLERRRRRRRPTSPRTKTPRSRGCATPGRGQGGDGQGGRRPGTGHRPPARRPALPGARLAARRAGGGQDVDVADPGEDARHGIPTHPVHPRPDALGHHRHGHHRGGRRHRAPQARIPPRADLHQLPPGRRDQPDPAQDPGGLAPGDAGERGHDRPADLPAQAAILRRRHPEPDRDGGDVSPARGPARPVHVQPQGEVPDRSTRKVKIVKGTTGTFTRARRIRCSKAEELLRIARAGPGRARSPNR